MSRGKQERPTTAALRMMLVPMLQKGMTYEQCAPSFGKSVATIKRWARHPDVVAALGEATEAAKEVAVRSAEEMVAKAWGTLAELMDEAEDERVRADAAKTVLSRLGSPEATKSEAAVTTKQDGVRVHIVDTVEAIREAARGGKG